MSEPTSYDKKEEIASYIIHGFGTLASIAGLIVLLVRAVRLDSLWMITSFAIYGASLILLFLSSTMYHGISHTKVKSVLRVVDHGSIYILIAGTYTPFTLVSLRGHWGWSLFGTVWGLALGGILFGSFTFRALPRTETATYVLMGWLSAIVIHRLLDSIGLIGVIFLILGGLIYTLGVIFYKWKGFPYNHAIWHLFVLSGAVCHFLAVYFYVSPK
ncbi:hemolysin III family protein [Candidatus Bipolaricaulota bacterium]|nr:hemolysin III family protein [Candidatus Bipolaricaulota bacterium]